MSINEAVGPVTKVYPVVVASGQAQVYQGDQYYHFHNTDGAQRPSSNLQFPDESE